LNFDLQDQERLLTDSQQQAIILDGQLEQANENVHHLEVTLESYKQKYQLATDQMNNIQESFNNLQDQLADSRNKVNFMNQIF
jgi:chromosome segregation ATPase